MLRKYNTSQILTFVPMLCGSCHSRCLGSVRLSQHLLFIKHFPATILSLTQGVQSRLGAGCVTGSALRRFRLHQADSLNKIPYFQCTKGTKWVLGCLLYLLKRSAVKRGIICVHLTFDIGIFGFILYLVTLLLYY